MSDRFQKINELYGINNGSGHASGGMASAELNRPSKGQENVVLAGGEVGGAKAVGNQAAHFIDWINGNGAYGQSGRDFSFSITSLAIVNPGAAGIILGSMGLASAAYGIATSSAMRFWRARRRMERLFKSILSKDGYMVSRWKIFKKNRNNKYDSYIGPNNLKETVMSQIKEANSFYSANDLDAAVGGNMSVISRDKSLDNKISTYIVNTISDLYIPSKFIDAQKNANQTLVDAIKAGAKRDIGGNIERMQELLKKKNEIGPFSPITNRIAKELETINTIGKDICTEYEKLMQYNLKGGDQSTRSRVNDLNTLWGKCMEKITAEYKKVFGSICTSEEATTLATNVARITSVEDLVSSFNSYKSTCNVGDLFSGKLCGSNVSLTFEVVEYNPLKYDGELKLRVVNSGLYGVNPVIVTTTIDKLYDEYGNVRRFAKVSNGTSESRNFYKMHLPVGVNLPGAMTNRNSADTSMNQYGFVLAWKGKLDDSVYGTVNYRNTAGVQNYSTDVMFYQFVNSFIPSNSVAIGTYWLPIQTFDSLVIDKGYEEVNREGEVSGFVKKHESYEYFTEFTAINECFVRLNESMSDDEISNLLNNYKGIQFAPQGLYILRSGHDKGKVVATGIPTNGHVDYVILDEPVRVSKDTSAEKTDDAESDGESIHSITIDEWYKLSPLYLHYSIPCLGNTDEYAAEDESDDKTDKDDEIGAESDADTTVPDDVPDDVDTGSILSTEKRYPITYRKFWKKYLLACSTIDVPKIDEILSTLSDYYLVPAADKGCVLYKGEHPLYATNLSRIYVFRDYIKSLGGKQLFKDQEDYEKKLKMIDVKESFNAITSCSAIFEKDLNDTDSVESAMTKVHTKVLDDHYKMKPYTTIPSEVPSCCAAIMKYVDGRLSEADESMGVYLLENIEKGRYYMVSHSVIDEMKNAASSEEQELSDKTPIEYEYMFRGLSDKYTVLYVIDKKDDTFDIVYDKKTDDGCKVFELKGIDQKKFIDGYSKLDDKKIELVAVVTKFSDMDTRGILNYLKRETGVLLKENVLYMFVVGDEKRMFKFSFKDNKVHYCLYTDDEKCDEISYGVFVNRILSIGKMTEYVDKIDGREVITINPESDINIVKIWNSIKGEFIEGADDKLSDEAILSTINSCVLADASGVVSGVSYFMIFAQNGLANIGKSVDISEMPTAHIATVQFVEKDDKSVVFADTTGILVRVYNKYISEKRVIIFPVSWKDAVKPSTPDASVETEAPSSHTRTAEPTKSPTPTATTASTPSMIDDTDETSERLAESIYRIRNKYREMPLYYIDDEKVRFCRLYGIDEKTAIVVNRNKAMSIFEEAVIRYVEK